VAGAIERPFNAVIGWLEPNITVAQLADLGLKRISVGGVFSRLALATAGCAHNARLAAALRCALRNADVARAPNQPLESAVTSQKRQRQTSECTPVRGPMSMIHYRTSRPVKDVYADAHGVDRVMR
jgi:hypothetical protein